MGAEASFVKTVEAVRRGAHTVRSALKLVRHALDRVDSLVATVGADSRQVAEDATLFWGVLSESTSRLHQHARATPRVAAALTEVARLAAVYRFAFMKAGFMSAASAATYLDQVHVREGRKLRAFCERQGGGLLKVGQVISTRGDLLPAAFIAELQGLQDSAEPPENAEVEAALDEWMPRWREQFTLDAPLAAASLAVVFRGHLPDGTAVAVKVQRPGIEKVIADDQSALSLIARLVKEAAPEALAGLDVGPILNEVAQSLGEEIDFVAEREMGEAFLAALPAQLCRVPAPMLSANPRVLVMELIDGQRLPDALREMDADEVAALLSDLARTFAHTMLVHGLVHGDPHPGNILALSGPKESARLALLDFGSALRLTNLQRKAYLGLLIGLMGRQRGPLIAALMDLGLTEGSEPASRASMETLADELSAMPRPTDLAAIDPREELERGLALMRSHTHLQMPGHLIRVGRALGTLGGLFLTHRAALTGARLDLGRLLMGVILEASRR